MRSLFKKLAAFALVLVAVFGFAACEMDGITDTNYTEQLVALQNELNELKDQNDALQDENAELKDLLDAGDYDAAIQALEDRINALEGKPDAKDYDSIIADLQDTIDGLLDEIDTLKQKPRREGL